jgi:hypothetical protein
MAGGRIAQLLARARAADDLQNGLLIKVLGRMPDEEMKLIDGALASALGF